MIEAPKLTDSHCHLDFPDFEGELDQIIARAAEAGVHRMVTICTRLRQEPQVRAIAETHAPVFYAAGTHPMNADKEPLAKVEELLALATHPKFVAIGETGLDYHYTAESAEIQKQSLRVHIEAAQKSNLPLIIHARAADEDMAEILSSKLSQDRYADQFHDQFRCPQLFQQIASNQGDHRPDKERHDGNQRQGFESGFLD